MLRAGLAAMLLLAQASGVGAQNRLSVVVPPSLNKCFDILQLEKIEATGDGHIRGTANLLAQYREVGGWIAGYLTARIMYDVQMIPVEGKLAQGISINQLIRWIISYCQANPTKQINDAALELTETLRKAKP